jgi:hypothetical protein
MFITLRLGTVGARHVAELNDGSSGVAEGQEIFAVDGAVRVEELVGDVGEDGGAACGDAALGEEDQEAGKKLVDVDGGVKLRELREEVGGEVEGVAGRCGQKGADGGAGAEMVETEPKMGIGGVESATLAVGETVLAAATGFGTTLGRLRLRCDR